MNYQQLPENIQADSLESTHLGMAVGPEGNRQFMPAGALSFKQFGELSTGPIPAAKNTRELG